MPAPQGPPGPRGPTGKFQSKYPEALTFSLLRLLSTFYIPFSSLQHSIIRDFFHHTKNSDISTKEAFQKKVGQFLGTFRRIQELTIV